VGFHCVRALILIAHAPRALAVPSMSARRVFVGSHVLLAGASDPAPGTIEVAADGTILNTHTSLRPCSDYPSLKAEDYIDAGDRWILPGIVEYVLLHVPSATVR
jgi:allantoinase